MARPYFWGESLRFRCPRRVLGERGYETGFRGKLDADRLLTIIGAATGTNPRDGRTLVFLDEIQECPRAITALKMFCEQRPDVPVVAAGSLLGVALNREREKDGDGTSWPVGKVDYLDLHPLSFDEFVREIGNSALADAVSQGDADLISVFSERLTDLLRIYYYVGGMPEAVCRYSETGDFAAARAVQQTLLADYEHDFSKHVESALEVERIRQTWHSVPVQLARESDLRRFSYASVREGGRGRDYRDAVAWLVDAGLVTKIPRVTKPGIPLKGYADEMYFKLYLLDIGLLGAATGLEPRVLVEGNRLFTEYKAFMPSSSCASSSWRAVRCRTTGRRTANRRRARPTSCSRLRGAPSLLRSRQTRTSPGEARRIRAGLWARACCALLAARAEETGLAGKRAALRRQCLPGHS